MSPEDHDHKPDLPSTAGDASNSDASQAPGVDAQSGEPPSGAGRPRRRRQRRRGRRSGDGLPVPHGEVEAGSEGGAVLKPEPMTPDATPLFAAVVSGDFDTQDDVAAEVPDSYGTDEVLESEELQEAQEAQEAQGALPPPESADDGRRVLAPDVEAPKLHKVLAQSGVGSRRDLEQWIAEGRVSVNGEPAHVGQRVSFGDRVAIDGKPVKVRITPPLPRVLAYHKPAGEVVTHEDPQGRPTVFRNLPRLAGGKWQSVGRLDINTEGLLLFTNSGDLANRLMHPRFGVEREYAARVLGELSTEDRQRLLDGVEVDGYTSCFLRIEDGGGEGANRWYRVVIAEGRYREVRKLFDAVGHVVSRLIRIRYGSIVLPRGLRRGAWVDLPSHDVKLLRQITGATRQGQGQGQSGRNGPPKPKGKRGGRQEGRRRDDDRVRSSEVFDEDLDHVGPIPNPLQQTYDKRAFQQSRKQRVFHEDGPIPNPLQQTYDKRHLMADRVPERDLDEDGPIPNPLQQTYDRRFASPGKPSGSPRSGPSRSRKKPARDRQGGGTERQPDPLKTSAGFIGADALHGKGRSGGRGGGRRGRR